MSIPETEPVHCERCGGEWNSPIHIDHAVKKRIVESYRNQPSVIETIRLLREATGIQLRDAKAIMQHMPREPGKCHWCYAVLDGAEFTVCAKCRSINYAW